ncbi:MAG: GNAT family N-acetyltransferase [Clostridia bacterium]|nr:GNAT family N-acetyltransferase [Clostridia bacterium]
MLHKGTVQLETERLILRKFNANDISSMFHNWASNGNVTKYLTWPAHTSIDTTRSIVEEWVSRYSETDFYQWAIELKAIGQPIGSISVVRIKESVCECEIGYCIGEQWWKQGITTEAFRRVIKYLLEEVCVNRISAKHDTNNPYSGKVMLKCGLQYEGTLRKAGKNSNGICDLAVYATVK